MQSMKASVESMNIVLRHRSVGIQTMRAVIEACTDAGKLIDVGHTEAAKRTLSEILERVSDIADMYVELQNEVLSAEKQSAQAVNELAAWLKATLP
jgi:hypothetical protein